ncbi:MULTISPECIES: bifunctional glutamate N-acetyltransferase/amino-acid acetyltransferase ArgJ [Nocardiopsis]|uniref:Arginine biosynthesis bifunctional protein ArgJ n=1 Tax=Nocardiopsis sinuspersici TaxID=501010 RepID=A0A1V3C5B5_9ACTN|nr:MULTISPECIES: bifunctional glutamate N-acetyltransferase/amino-acid acetyltransferase ArgJ [Nocardiopsis]NYH52184.1 glutamate N-acetyltransferase/amino-acid N-acetyltransferase [Nocardiopsis sinuspersici]OOC55716.1 bifunctional ornithine acetyltransferase/N-acetylglutamate synthase [Nocardiopsis sinuspersici]
MSSQTPVPAGFRGVAGNIGIKDPQDDFFAVVSEVPASVSAVFTRSRFAGPSVLLSRRAAADGRARGVTVIARNANVATGRIGDDYAREVQERVARAAGVAPEEILVASTGVIGRPYPMDKVRAHLDSLPAEFPPADLDRAAAAMMTTDTRPKTASAKVGGATVTGIAKGVGMIEPNMATMLAWFFTDADLERSELDEVFRRVVDRTFNALSIDTDTSTSDSAAVFANGLAGPVDVAAFEAALHEVALKLVRMIASDGEGASKLIEVRVSGARDDAQAKRVAKAVVNSPLVKTAVHGADPNWGRVTMAVGKCEEETDILPERVRISFGDVETYPAESTDEVLERAAQHMKGDEVVIGVDLGIADGAFTVYGCDLTEGYIRINADYTT